MALGENNIQPLFQIEEKLRENGFSSDMNFENKSLGASFKIANRKNAHFALILGDDERNRNVIQLKDLQKQEQIEVSLDKLIDTLKLMKGE